MEERGLSEQERQVLQALARNGTMTPLEVSVKTLILPDEVLNAIRSLQRRGYLASRDLPEGPEREAITLTEKGRRVLRS